MAIKVPNKFYEQESMSSNIMRILNNKFFISLCLMTALTGNCLSDQVFTVPPSDSSYRYAPVISDEMMQKCVEVYNQTKWLKDELSAKQYNLNSNKAVKDFNKKVDEVNSLSSWFNQNCAGKQSKSACEATNKLNKQHGLPTQECK